MHMNTEIKVWHIYTTKRNLNFKKFLLDSENLFDHNMESFLINFWSYFVNIYLSTNQIDRSIDR